MDEFFKAEELREKWIEKYKDHSKLFENLRHKQMDKLSGQMLEMYAAAAKQNHALSARRLALYYSNNQWVNNTFNYFHGPSEGNKKALPYLLMAVSLGDEDSLSDLANYYYHINQIDQAIEFFEKEQSEKDWELLVRCYGMRSNTEEKELALLRRHRTKNWNHELRYCILEMRAGNVNYMEEFALHNPAGIYQLACYYHQKKDGHTAAKWFKQLYFYEYKADEANDHLLIYLESEIITKQELWELYNLALRDVVGIELEKKTALECDLMTVKKEHAYYISRVAIGYLLGDLVEKDVNKAFTLLKKCHEVNPSEEIKCYLGDCYYNGWGVKRDYTQAGRLYEKVSYLYEKWQNAYEVTFHKEKKYAFHNPNKAKLHRDVQLSYCYCRCNKYDLMYKALPVIIEMYGDKQAWAMYELGCMYYNGKGVLRDYKKAFEYHSKAANANYIYAYNELGRCYLSGFGIEKDCGKAYEWFKKFLESDSTQQHIPYFNMGLCYEDGHLFEKDLKKAYECYEKSAALNYEPAKQKVAELKPQIVISVTKKVEMKQEKVVVKETQPHVFDSAKAQLESLIGLKKVKKEIVSLENMMKMNRLRQEMGLPVNEVSKHMVFTGNPGTGKTTVARVIARIFKENGFLSKGHLIETDRGGMIGQFIGTTPKKTTRVFESAKGGVLFIDEAYALIPKDSDKDYGPEAVATLIKLMEDQKDDIVVIVAGYKDEMKHFIDSNPGLKSRFTTYIDFEDYTPEEMQQIFELMMEKGKYQLDEAAKEELMKLWVASAFFENFGNGRGVRNVYEKTISNQTDRLLACPVFTRDEAVLIKKEDVPEPKDVFH